jgi:SAM-dependent methyltransferase
MMHILLLVVQVILIIVFFGLIIFFIFWAIGNFRNSVPFVTAPSAVLENIAKAMNINDNSVVYDLGCGDGRILIHLSKINKNAQYIGVENNIFPIILARIESYFNYKKNGIRVGIVNGDFFKQDLSKATHIFTYLYPNIMDKLLPKFEKELKPGTRLVSLSFQFSGKKPLEKISLNRSKYKLGREIYIYEF